IGGAAGGRGAPGGGPLLDVTLDGERVPVDNPRSFRLKVAAGPHAIGVALVDRQRGAGVDEQYSDFRIDSAFTPAGRVGTVAIPGPFNATSAGDPPSRRQIFICHPAAANEEAPCARKVVAQLAHRAYRRTVLDDEVETLMGFYQQGRSDGGFEAGIQQAIA